MIEHMLLYEDDTIRIIFNKSDSTPQIEEIYYTYSFKNIIIFFLKMKI